ncbi:MAG: hypothetical protein ABI629_00380 [bacterium]
MNRRSIGTLPILALLLTTSGCLIDSTMESDGSGTMRVEYRAGPNSTADAVKRLFTSSNAEVTDITVDKDMNAKVALKYKDVTALNKSKFFRSLTVTRSEDEKAGTKTIKGVVTNARALDLPDDSLKYFGKDAKISITLPGEIVQSNATTSSDKTATWNTTLNKLMGADKESFEVTFKSSGSAASGTPATTPASAAGTTPAKTAAAAPAATLKGKKSK